MNGLLIQWGTQTDSSAYGTVKFDTNAVFTNTPIITATAFKKDEVGQKGFETFMFKLGLIK